MPTEVSPSELAEIRRHSRVRGSVRAAFVYVRNPFMPHEDRVVVEIRKARRVMSLAKEHGIDLARPHLCLVNGAPLLRADFRRLIRDGEVVTFIRLPEGRGSNPLTTILQIALAIAIPQLAPVVAETLGVSVLAARIVVGMAGMALISAIGQRANPNGLADAMTPSPTYDLQAQGNSARLGSAVPEQFGRMQYFPEFAASPYVEYDRNEQYLYELFCLGRGFHQIDAIEIENTPIANFEEVSTQVALPGDAITLFPTNVLTSNLVSGQELSDAWIGPFVAAPAGSITNRLGIDIVCPKGLFFADEESGSLSAYAVRIAIEVRLIDDEGAAQSDWIRVSLDRVAQPGSVNVGMAWRARALSRVETGNSLEFETVVGAIVAEQDWPPAGVTVSGQVTTDALLGQVIWSLEALGSTSPIKAWDGTVDYLRIDGQSATPVRRSYTLNIPAGRHEVRIKRLEAKNLSQYVGNDVAWTGLRAFLAGGNTNPDCTMLAVKMRASNQLSSQAARRIRVTSTRMLVDPAAPGAGRVATRSIAAAADYIATTAVDPSQFDRAWLAAYSAVWAARGDHCDVRFEQATSWWDALNLVLRCGRSLAFRQSGILRFVRDELSPANAALFCQRNIIPGSVRIAILQEDDDVADAVEVTYLDARVWKPRTIKCMVPGSAGAKVARLDYKMGLTDEAHAQRDGLYEAADNAYRRLRIDFETELEGFIPSIFDPVAFEWPIVSWGVAGDVVAQQGLILTLSRDLEWKAGEQHFVGLKRFDGKLEPPIMVTAGAAANQVVLAHAPTFQLYLGDNAERTAFVFGPSNQLYLNAKVLAIRPRGSTVQISLMNEDARVHTADGTPPPVVNPPWLLPAPPAAPVLADFDAVVDGSPASPFIKLSWALPGGATSVLIEISDDSEHWTRLGNVDDTSFGFSAAPGPLWIRLAAVGLRRGPYVIKQIDAGAVRPPAKVTGLRAESGQTGSVLAILWDPADRAESYLVEVLAGNAVRRIRTVTETRFQYTAEDAVFDGGPWRAITFQVKAVNAGASSSNWASITLTNPAPAAPSGVSIEAAIKALSVRVNRPSDTDYAGTLIWAGSTSGFAADAAHLVYDGPDTQVLLAGIEQTTYLRIAHYDDFGKAELNLSPEFSGTPGYAAGIPETNALPTSPPASLGTAVVVVRDQDGNARLARWDGQQWTFEIEDLIVANRIVASSLAALSANLGAVTSGVFTLDAGSHIKGGMTDPGVGSGFWMGYVVTGVNAGEYRAYFGTQGGARLEITPGAVTVYGPDNQVLMSSGSGVAWAKVAGVPNNVRMLNGSEAINNAAISLTSNGILAGGGGGQVTLPGLGAGAFATLNQINAFNSGTYIANAAIKTAMIDTIYANQVITNSLAALSANLGDIYAGRLIGANGRTVIDMNVNLNGSFIRVQDTAGNVTLDIPGNGPITLNGPVINRNALKTGGNWTSPVAINRPLVSTGEGVVYGDLPEVTIMVPVSFYSSGGVYQAGAWVRAFQSINGSTDIEVPAEAIFVPSKNPNVWDGPSAISPWANTTWVRGFVQIKVRPFENSGYCYGLVINDIQWWLAQVS